MLNIYNIFTIYCKNKFIRRTFVFFFCLFYLLKLFLKNNLITLIYDNLKNFKLKNRKLKKCKYLFLSNYEYEESVMLPIN